MAEVKWIKIVTDIFDDDKILIIESMPEADSIIVIWFKLLCLAGKQNNGGVLMFNDKIPYTEEMLATIFRRPINTVRLALKIFENYGMIEIIENVITIPKWEYHQSLEKLQRQKAQTKARVEAYRKRQKMQAIGQNAVSNANVTHYNSVTEQLKNAKVTHPEEDIDIERDIDTDKDKDKKGVGREEPTNQPTNRPATALEFYFSISKTDSINLDNEFIENLIKCYPNIDLMKEFENIQLKLAATDYPVKDKQSLKRYIFSWFKHLRPDEIEKSSKPQEFVSKYDTENLNAKISNISADDI